MLLNAYTVYDRKSLQYHAPFFAVSDGAAVRSFADLANDNSTTVGRHPGDFVLYLIGHYNDANGQLLPIASPIHLSDALPLIRAANKAQSSFSFDPPKPAATIEELEKAFNGEDR